MAGELIADFFVGLATLLIGRKRSPEKQAKALEGLLEHAWPEQRRAALEVVAVAVLADAKISKDELELLSTNAHSELMKAAMDDVRAASPFKDDAARDEFIKPRATTIADPKLREHVYALCFQLLSAGMTDVGLEETNSALRTFAAALEISEDRAGQIGAAVLKGDDL